MATPRAVPLAAAGWEAVTVQSLALVLHLPDGSGWSWDEQAPLGLRALHAATGSELRVRGWLDGRAARPEACAERARLVWTTLPGPGSPGLIDDRPLRAPAGYRGRVTVAVVALADGTLEGRLGAVGAGAGRCLALWFRTRARGVAAERAVAESLAVVAEGTVDRLAIVSIEDRVTRPRPP